MKRKARRRFSVLPWLAALVVVGGLGWWAWVRAHPANSWTSNLITATVTRGDLVESVSATGSVTAQTGAEVKIGSQITGRIKTAVRRRRQQGEGGTVHRGPGPAGYSGAV